MRKTNTKGRKSRSYIRLRTILYFAFRNLLYKRLRSSLTVLGVVIGIGSIFLLLSFGMGLQNIVQEQITDGKAVNTVDVSSSNSKVVNLTPERVSQINALPQVERLSGVYTAASKLTIDGATADVVAYGIDLLYLELDNPAVVAGELINPADSKQAVISNSLLLAIGIKEPSRALGETLTLKIDISGGDPIEEKVKLVGVIDSGSGSEVFVSADIFSNASVESYTQVRVLAKDRDEIPDLRSSIESLGFDTTSPVDTLEQVDQVFRFFSLILAGLGSIGMIIAILGMLNTLTVSLLERTREIALMMTLGGRPKDMLLLFISEALILSIVGGVLGMVFAFGIGKMVDIILNQLAQSRGATDSFTVFAAPLWLVVGTLVFMSVVGFVVALVPARRAAKINPVESLRQD